MRAFIDLGHCLSGSLRIFYWFSAEKAVNERLAHTPELYLLALAQFAIAAETEVVSSLLSIARGNGCTTDVVVLEIWHTSTIYKLCLVKLDGEAIAQLHRERKVTRMANIPVFC